MAAAGALQEMVGQGIADGALDGTPGALYLLRFDNRFVWVQVLESGWSATRRLCMCG